jgi:hypothetical protein
VGPRAASNCATGPATEGAGASAFWTGPMGDIVTISPDGHRTTPVLSNLPSVNEEAIQEWPDSSRSPSGTGRKR